MCPAYLCAEVCDSRACDAHGCGQQVCGSRLWPRHEAHLRKTALAPEFLGVSYQGSNFDHRIRQLPHRSNEQRHNRAIELRVRAALQLRQCLFGRPRFLIRAVAGDRIERIRHRDDARAERNLLSGLCIRIARTVEIFVVVQHHFADASQRRKGLQNLRPKHHM